jgi:hypothetical protein
VVEINLKRHKDKKSFKILTWKKRKKRHLLWVAICTLK